MQKQHAEEYFKTTYQTAIYEFDGLIENSLSVVNELLFSYDLLSHEKTKYLVSDARFTMFGKMVSSFNSTRIILKQILDFFKNENWDVIYHSEYITLLKDCNYSYLRELNKHLLFASFISIASELEASISIVTRHLKAKNRTCSDNYKGFILDNLGLKKFSTLIDIIRNTRNSIHNNGLHVSKKNESKHLSFSYHGINLSFYDLKTIDINWEDCFNIYKEIINMLFDVNNQLMVKDETYIKDIVAESRM